METELHIARMHKITKECEAERQHTPVPMEARWHLSAADVLALRQWLQSQHQTFMALQKETEALYLQGKSDEDGLSLGYAVSAYRRVQEMIDDVIRWGGDACLNGPYYER